MGQGCGAIFVEQHLMIKPRKRHATSVLAEPRLEALAGRLSGKKVRLAVAIRPEVLGGVRLRVGNVLYDGSLQSQLGQLAQKLAQASV